MSGIDTDLLRCQLDLIEAYMRDDLAYIGHLRAEPQVTYWYERIEALTAALGGEEARRLCWAAQERYTVVIAGERYLVRARLRRQLRALRAARRFLHQQEAAHR